MSFLLFLAQKGLFREENIPEMESEAKSAPGGLDEVLVRGDMSLGDILKLKSEYYGVPVRTLGETKIPLEVLKYIPEDSARHYQVAPLGVENKVLEIGIVDPDMTQARDAVQFIASKLGLPFKLFLLSQADFNQILIQYQNLSGEVGRALSELTVGDNQAVVDNSAQDNVSSVSTHGRVVEEKSGESKIVEDAPVTKIVAVILKHAVEGNASDVHIEHIGDKVRVRFRVDGVMYTSIILPTNIHSAIVARIKILAQLKLDEKRKPQDGRFSARMDDKKVDFRVSTFPAYYGEKVVMRILDTGKGVKTLDQMGLEPESLKLLREAI
ncbi:MAG: Type IV-A pilus assembly ATPase PilB, partial [Parcubacteria group bacterium GW2011_GWA2_47_7]